MNSNNHMTMFNNFLFLFFYVLVFLYLRGHLVIKETS